MRNSSNFLLTLFILLATLITQAQEKQRVLVISGGGSRGAWGGAVVAKLVQESGRNYQCIVGTSAGSLLAPLIALDDFDKMKEGFTKINQKSVFNKNPFQKNGKIKAGRAFVQVLFGQPNLGETYNLKKRIKEFVSPQEYQRLKDNKKTIIVSSVSLSTNRLTFRSSDSINYDRMVNWVWASGNQPVFMTDVPIDGEKWVDGGVKENVPIVEGINYARKHKIENVDVIVLNTLDEHTEEWPKEDEKSNIIPKILRTINIFSDEIKESDIEIGRLRANEGDIIHLNVYHMTPKEYSIAPQSLFFTQKQQEDLWEAGTIHMFKKSEKLFIKNLNNVIITIYD